MLTYCALVSVLSARGGCRQLDLTSHTKGGNNQVSRVTRPRNLHWFPQPRQRNRPWLPNPCTSSEVDFHIQNGRKCRVGSGVQIYTDLALTPDLCKVTYKPQTVIHEMRAIQINSHQCAMKIPMSHNAQQYSTKTNTNNSKLTSVKQTE